MERCNKQHKMKILLIQEAGVHEANKNFRESYALKKTFDAFGHPTTIWGRHHANFEQIPDFEEYDIILTLENYGDSWIPDLSQTKKPYKIFYAMDSHVRSMEPYEKIYRDGKYHFLLCGIKMHSVGENRAWWPIGFNCIPELFYKDASIEKDIFIGFVGSHVTAQREAMINYMRDNHGMDANIFVIGKKMVDLINKFQIHFNFNISNSCNNRNFETINCGTCLLTNNNIEYPDLGFIHEKNCLIYNNTQELDEIVKFYKDNPNRVKEISENALILAKKHTCEQRVKTFLNFFKDKI